MGGELEVKQGLPGAARTQLSVIPKEAGHGFELSVYGCPLSPLPLRQRRWINSHPPRRFLL